AAAVGIADAAGLGAVSMQRVASEVGFATMALYRYVPGKTELISIMIDTILGDPPRLAGCEGWRDRLEEWATQSEAAFRAHPWALQVSAAGRVIGPNELGWLEAGVVALAGTGLTGAEQADAVLAVSGHVRNWLQYSLGAAGARAGTGEQWLSVIGDLVGRHRDRYPALLAAMSAGGLGGPQENGQQFGLRCVLDGIGVRISERAAARA
ncbi:MAG TPA: TetR/AcrR family transcriptional regulator C-terminal domain-containing protein, partial [Streptosporangiaceae bacterium]